MRFFVSQEKVIRLTGDRSLRYDHHQIEIIPARLASEMGDVSPKIPFDSLANNEGDIKRKGTGAPNTWTLDEGNPWLPLDFDSNYDLLHENGNVYPITENTRNELTITGTPPGESAFGWIRPKRLRLKQAIDWSASGYGFVYGSRVMQAVAIEGLSLSASVWGVGQLSDMPWVEDQFNTAPSTFSNYLLLCYTGDLYRITDTFVPLTSNKSSEAVAALTVEQVGVAPVTPPSGPALVVSADGYFEYTSKTGNQLNLSTSPNYLRHAVEKNSTAMQTPFFVVDTPLEVIVAGWVGVDTASSPNTRKMTLTKRVRIVDVFGNVSEWRADFEDAVPPDTTAPPDPLPEQFSFEQKGNDLIVRFPSGSGEPPYQVPGDIQAFIWKAVYDGGVLYNVAPFYVGLNLEVLYTPIQNGQLDLYLSVRDIVGNISNEVKMTTIPIEVDWLPEEEFTGDEPGVTVIGDEISDGTPEVVTPTIPNLQNLVEPLASQNFDGDPLDPIGQPGTRGFAINPITGQMALQDVLVRGTVYAERGDIGGFIVNMAEGLYAGDDATRVQMKPGAGFWAGHNTQLSAPFYVTQAGALHAVSGDVGSWILDVGLLKSAASGKRIELDQANLRISIFEATENEKVVMGYLAGLARRDGGGNWGVGDYGFWAAQGDQLVIDGDAEYVSGDWLIQNDASYLVRNAGGYDVLRLGTDTGDKGLFIYDGTVSQTILAKLITDEIYVGTVNNYLQYTVAGGLVIEGYIILTNQISSTDIDDVNAYTTDQDKQKLSTLNVDTPSGAGLFMDATHLGYYDTSVWKTYMDNTGNFYLGGTSGSLRWNGTTLTIAGDVSLAGDFVASASNIITGGTFQTAATQKRIEIRGSGVGGYENAMVFYGGGDPWDEVIRIDDEIYPGSPGIKLTGAASMIYMVGEGQDNTQLYPSRIAVFGGVTTPTGLSAQGSYIHSSADTRMIYGLYSSGIQDNYTPFLRIGVHGFAQNTNVSSTIDTVGIYGSSLNSGSGTAWAGYFKWGDVYVKNTLTIDGNFSNVLKAPNGTVGAPAFTFASALSTGVYYMGSGQMSIVTSGSRRLYFDSAGTHLSTLSTTAIPGNLYCAGVGANIKRSTAGRLADKENVRRLEIDTSKIYDLNPISFASKLDLDKENKPIDGFFGLIVEEVHKTLPNLCGYNEKGQPDWVQYPLLPVLMLPEMKKLRNRILDLETQVATLKQQIAIA